MAERTHEDPAAARFPTVKKYNAPVTFSKLEDKAGYNQVKNSLQRHYAIPSDTDLKAVLVDGVPKHLQPLPTGTLLRGKPGPRNGCSVFTPHHKNLDLLQYGEEICRGFGCEMVPHVTFESCENEPSVHVTGNLSGRRVCSVQRGGCWKAQTCRSNHAGSCI